MIIAFIAIDCGGAQGTDDATTPTSEESVTSEPLPIPAEDDVAAGSDDASEEDDSDAGDTPEPCDLSIEDRDASRQIALFTRWLRDQTVGRHVTIDRLSPECGDRGGFLVLDIHLSGPAGGLDSLGRALTLYYPGSAWTVLAYERLDGDGIPLRITVDVRIPCGAVPRHRCQWDGSVPCP